MLPLLVGPLSDATRTPFGRRRPYMAFALGPMALSLAMVAFMPNFVATAFVLFAFFFAYYIYEPPYRGLYPDLLPEAVFGRSQGAQHIMRGIALGHRARRRRLPARRLGAVSVRAGRRGLGGRAGRRGRPRPRACGVAAGTTSASARTSPRPGESSSPRRDVALLLLANTAWEGTFAGMYTFVVLYITKGLDQPLYVSSTVLAVVAVGYVVAATLAGRLGDRFGIGRVRWPRRSSTASGSTLVRARDRVALVVLRAHRSRSPSPGAR